MLEIIYIDKPKLRAYSIVASKITDRWHFDMYVSLVVKFVSD